MIHYQSNPGRLSAFAGAMYAVGAGGSLGAAVVAAPSAVSAIAGMLAAVLLLGFAGMAYLTWVDDTEGRELRVDPHPPVKLLRYEGPILQEDVDDYYEGPILQEDVDDYYGGVVPPGRWLA